MTSSQGSIGLRSRLLNTVLGLSTSKVQMVKVSDGRKITETESRAPSFQGSLTLSRYLSFGAGLIRNSRDYKNYDNSSLNGIRMIDRYNAGAVLNLGPLFSVTINSLTIMENLLQELPLVDAGPLLRWEWSQGVYGDMGSIEYAKTTQDAVKKDSDGERPGIDLGEISGYSFSFSAVVNNIMIGLYRGSRPLNNRLFL